MAGSENELNNSSSGESEEEEDQLSSEGSESESEPDKTPSAKKTQLTSNSDSDESDSQSESVPDPNIKPLASIPMMEADNISKKPRSKKSTLRYSPPPIKPSTGKRPAAEVDAGESKRVKKETVVAVPAPDAVLADNGGGEKKQLFQRLWSEENEIELIEGMINYANEKGKDPLADVIEFHEFVKDSLHVDVNDKQVLTKARRLKKKYENNAAKVDNNGKVRSFSNPHEKKMYELSKNLWGSDGNKNVVKSSSKKLKAKVNVTPKTNKSSKAVGSSNGNGGVDVSDKQVVAYEVKPKVVSGHGSDHVVKIGLPITDELIINEGLELLSGAKKAEMEEKLKNLKVEELEHYVKKIDVLKESALVVLDAVLKSGAK
ncbi:probable transcription factor At1g61730 [Rutidosis leptorrhynchoides]|uniref:probable transcription factor At1g61730 n=1 Tax=Rutidosis leptorrhynchoides TaxID=125765 RepID=UPI003A991DA6